MGADEKTALDWGIHHGGAYQRHFIFGAYGAKGKQAAAEWTLQQPQHDAGAALYFVAGSKTWNDSPAAAAWVASLPANFPVSSPAQAVANIWSRKTPADIPKIRDWIQKLPIADAEKASVAKAIVLK